MTEMDFIKGLKLIGMKETDIKEQVEVFYEMRDIDSNFSWEMFFEIAKKNHIEIESKKGIVTLDGDKHLRK